ncbi:MAG: ABC transporter permease subunit, partial [Nitrospinota bacterium]
MALHTKWFPRLVLLPLILFVGGGLCLPLLFLGITSLGFGEKGIAGMNLGNYLLVLQDAGYREALITSLVLSTCVTAGSLLVSLVPAWVLARKAFRGKRVMRMILTLPLSFSGVIIGFLTIIMLGRVGVVPMLSEWLLGKRLFSGSAYTLTGLVVAYLYFEIPRATLTLETALRQCDFRLVVAAKSLGANRWQRICSILFPLLLPALLSSMAVTFAASMGSFGVALIISQRIT